MTTTHFLSLFIVTGRRVAPGFTETTEASFPANAASTMTAAVRGSVVQVYPRHVTRFHLQIIIHILSLMNKRLLSVYLISQTSDK